MIENMKIRSIKRAPRDPIAGVASSKVLNIYCSFCYFLINLNTLPILSVRRIVPRMAILSPIPIQFSVKMIKVPTTTVKSNMFQLSLKYAHF